MRSVGAWIAHGETRRDEDGCVLVPRKMLKDVGKGDGLICEWEPHTVTLGKRLAIDSAGQKNATSKSIVVPEHEAVHSVCSKVQGHRGTRDGRITSNIHYTRQGVRAKYHGSRFWKAKDIDL